MGGNYSNKLVCCFCGESISSKKAVFLNVFPSIKMDEEQKLFSHKRCFVTKIHKSVILHPDFFEYEENNPPPKKNDLD